ncbi:MAG TPA: LacI family DNA-binding transcriptional regulator [Solirubrobacter sp.]|nr:LacI family DNA-binding transcriptional regulator [Solirubrobacter sp.]
MSSTAAPEPARAPNLKLVAERAEVSLSTASRALRGDQHVSPATRDRVLAAARTLGYEPHLAARALRTRSSAMVAAVIQDIGNQFYSYVARGITSVVRDTRYMLLLTDSEEDGAREAEILRTLLRARVEGVIIAPTVGNEDVLHLLQKQSVAIVQFDRTLAGLTSDAVRIDNYHGAYAATKYLLDLGHRSIGVIAGPQSATTGSDRLDGFLRAMAAHGAPVPDTHIRVSDFRRESGGPLAGELLDADPRPTALFVQNNALAEGVMGFVRQRGLRVPEDVALLVFDDPSWASFVVPPLTVVEQPAYTIGVTAAELLLRRMRGDAPSSTPTNVVIMPTLLVRGSCGGTPDARSKPLVVNGDRAHFAV